MIEKVIEDPTYLVDLVDYKETKMANRLLQKNESGSISLMALPAGQKMAEHKTPHEVLVFIIEGEGVVEIGGERKKIVQGQSFHFPANSPHALYTDKGFKMMLIILKNK